MEILEIEKTSWPPSYTIRLSQRARRTFLQITPKRGLEIVVPHKRKSPNIESLLHEKRNWIEKTLEKFTDRLTTQPLELIEKPDTIVCQALSEIWQITYHPKPMAKTVKLTRDPLDKQKLMLTGNVDNTKLCCQTLKKWLMRYALNTFSPWLYQLSLTTGLSYNRILIRGQTTLWGSCNASKTISLNYKLLFLPRMLAQHVLIHELCHTKYLNHSARFWQLFKKWDEHFTEHKKMLRSAERYLPRWLYLT